MAVEKAALTPFANLADAHNASLSCPRSERRTVVPKFCLSKKDDVARLSRKPSPDDSDRSNRMLTLFGQELNMLVALPFDGRLSAPNTSQT